MSTKVPTKPSDAARLARVFLTRPDDPQSIYPLCKLAGMRGIRTVRVLDRMMEIGWIEDFWQDASDARWPRRFYRLTERGRHEMPALLVPPADGARDVGTA